MSIDARSDDTAEAAPASVASGALLPCQKSSNSNGRVSAHHRKAAAALAWNVAAIIDRHGIDRVGFLTITPPDHVTDRAEWQRRWNSFATGYLRRRFPDYLRVVERMRSERIHAHILLAVGFDLRTGFDFTAAAAGDYRSASPSLRELWHELRDVMPAYGFGRHELMPIRSTANAMGSYVGKYLGKHLDARPDSDKGWRLVAYGSAARFARTRFSWALQGVQWRRGCRRLADMVAESRGLKAGTLAATGLAYALGPRWAYEWRETIAALGAAQE